MKKIGLLVLALVLALGSLGIAYARWSDTITISGTVNTGNVDINVLEYSGTEVYKDLDTEEAVICHWSNTGSGKVYGDNQPPDSGLLVAYAEAAAGSADDSVVVTFDNLFPCIDFTADLVLRYDGSIPVKVTTAEITLDITKIVGDVEVPAVEGVDYTATIVLTDVDGNPVGECYQLHQGDTVKAVGTIHIIQTPTDDNLDMMGASGTISGTLEVTQWNEACLPTPTTTPTAP